MNKNCLQKKIAHKIIRVLIPRPTGGLWSKRNIIFTIIYYIIRINVITDGNFYHKFLNRNRPTIVCQVGWRWALVRSILSSNWELGICSFVISWGCPNFALNLDTGSPMGTWKCNFSPYYDRPTKRRTDSYGSYPSNKKNILLWRFWMRTGLWTLCRCNNHIS